MTETEKIVVAEQRLAAEEKKNRQRRREALTSFENAEESEVNR